LVVLLGPFRVVGAYAPTAFQLPTDGCGVGGLKFLMQQVGFND
jgi:hypothetical protein